MRTAKALIAGIVACSLPFAAQAATLIPASNRVDMVHDASRGLVYVSNAGEIIRYDTGSSTLLAPISLGGDLGGVDISPDGNMLVVADRSGSSTDSWVYLIDLDSLAVTQAKVAKAFYEGGTYTAVYGGDGNVYTTSTFNGSGWVPFRKLDTSTLTWTELASVRQNTMLSTSGDAQSIAFAEANISDGAWGVYDIPTGQIVRRTGYTNGTSWFNFEIATDRLGTQFSIPTYDGTFVYDDVYQKIGTLGVYAGQQPIGVAYHPVEEIAYFPWAGTTQVRVYNMSTLTQIGAYDFGSQFSTTGNWAFVQGRTRLSRDGSLLMVSVTGGVGVQQQYAPLAAAQVSASTPEGQSVDIPLAGTIGNGGALTFEVLGPPSHGVAVLNGGVATYTPEAGFEGTDSFGYRVRYGRAHADGSVTVTVARADQPPVAQAASVSTNEDSAVAIALQASDPDGDALSYNVLTPPQHGILSGSGAGRVYTPDPNFNGNDSFTFSASDGQLSSNIATVNVQVASVNDPPVAVDGTVNTLEDTAASVTLQASDVDGDALTYSIVAQPQHGTLTGSGASLIYTPATNYHGADSFAFQASDGQTSSQVATISIQVASVNDAPNAMPDTATLTRNGSVAVAVLANDSDVDGDSLTISGVANPSHGTATVSGSGIVYVPARSYTGTDQFTYTISDGQGGSASALVTVSVLKK